jgi:1-phosphofructokinase
MIFTVTFNPSLDYVVSVDDFQLGRTNRTTNEQIFPGGKGINVSTVLHHLGIESTALGFTAGFTGEEIIRRVEHSGVKAEFIELPSGNSRINVKLKNYDGTEINSNGPDISPEKVAELTSRLNQLSSGDILVLAGSIPSSMASSTYCDILEQLKGKDILPVVDATRDLLMPVLAYRPFLIKPNKDELEEIFQTKLHSRADIITYAQQLQQRGAQNVLVSMGGDGAVLAAADGQVFETDAPRGQLINAVGAGDSMVAGFVAGWIEKKDYRHAFYMGVSAGSASAFSEGLAEREKVEAIYQSF